MAVSFADIWDDSSAYCSQEDRKHTPLEFRTVISPNLRLTMQNGQQNLAEFERAFMSEETDVNIQYLTILQVGYGSNTSLLVQRIFHKNY